MGDQWVSTVSSSAAKRTSSTRTTTTPAKPTWPARTNTSHSPSCTLTTPTSTSATTAWSSSHPGSAQNSHSALTSQLISPPSTPESKTSAPNPSTEPERSSKLQFQSTTGTSAE